MLVLVLGAGLEFRLGPKGKSSTSCILLLKVTINSKVSISLSHATSYPGPSYRPLLHPYHAWGSLSYAARALIQHYYASAVIGPRRYHWPARLAGCLGGGAWSELEATHLGQTLLDLLA